MLPGRLPGPLRRLTGIWAEETDALYDDERNGIRTADGHTYSCSTLCDLIHAETAQVQAEYTDDFYAGMPALTVNSFGSGCAWYIATRPDQAFLDAFYAERLADAKIAAPVPGLPAGVQVASREGEDGSYLFIMNFTRRETEVELPAGVNALTGEPAGGKTTLKVNGVIILKV